MTTQNAEQPYTIEVYDGSQHPAPHPYRVEYAHTERDARRIAAQLLGHSTLRGSASWERYQGGTVYQFGPRVDDNEHDYAVIVADEEATR